MIFYNPTNGDVLSTPISYKPRSCFIMTQLGHDLPDNAKIIRANLKRLILSKGFKEIDANSAVSGRDFLTKIWEMILAVPIGIAIITSEMRTSAISNIFYEIGLLNTLGKESLLIKCKDYKIPSDFIRTEYVEYNNDFDQKINQFFDNCTERAEHYEFMSELVEANPVLAIDYLRRAYLITNNDELKRKAKIIYGKHKLDDQATFFIKNFLGR